VAIVRRVLAHADLDQLVGPELHVGLAHDSVPVLNAASSEPTNRAALTRHQWVRVRQFRFEADNGGAGRMGHLK
jgi:hypothetical protein